MVFVKKKSKIAVCRIGSGGAGKFFLRDFFYENAAIRNCARGICVAQDVRRVIFVDIAVNGVSDGDRAVQLNDDEQQSEQGCGHQYCNMRF